MKKLLCCMAVLLLASAAWAEDDLQGKITKINTEEGIIEVSGVKIVAKNTRIEGLNDKPCNITDLKVGDIIDVDGSFTGPGVITATKIEVESTLEAKIEGTVTSVNGKHRKFKISGITVKVPEGTRLEGEDDLSITLDSITVGARVECEGAWTGKKEFTANKVERD